MDNCKEVVVKNEVVDNLYCEICQEYGHNISVACVTCKKCGEKGHARQDCRVDGKDIENPPHSVVKKEKDGEYVEECIKMEDDQVAKSKESKGGEGTRKKLKKSSGHASSNEQKPPLAVTTGKQQKKKMSVEEYRKRK